MRQVLRLLSTRYGVALIIAVLVLGVAGVAKAVSDPEPPPAAPLVGASNAVSPEADPDDDGEDPSASPAPPLTSPGATAPDKVAATFAGAWVKHTGVTPEQWRTGIAATSTRTLQDKLKETDPAAVPAESVTGTATVLQREASFVEALVPLNAGRLRLRLVAQNGRWLVDGVDWERT